MIELFKNKTGKEIYIHCVNEYNNDVNLKELREFVKSKSYGFGDDAHYIMWREIVNVLPKNFSFLEIGVYKGQVLALITLLTKIFNKKSLIYGVTPLSNLGDKYSVYDDSNYSEDIINLFKTFSLDFNIEKQIFNGLSTDTSIKNKLKSLPLFDLIYIDGGHDYDVVVSDINFAKTIIKIDGYIVTDDSSCYKEDIKGFGIFLGHEEVSNAVRDFLENDNNFIEVGFVGHNRIFKKIN
jgi:hypothetical protein